MNNKTLGTYDMMFSISINKINAMLRDLIELEEIPGKMSFMTDLNGENISLNEDFEQSFTTWKSRYNEELAAKIQQLRNELSLLKAPTPQNQSRKLALMEEIFEIQELIEQSKNTPDYDIACKAEIDKYTVATIPQNNNMLEFSIHLKNGLFWLKPTDSNTKKLGLKEVPFSTVRYTFNVKISDRIIKVKDMILSDEEKKQLVDELDDNLFKIEALFMDFQNSKLISYDDEKSIFPPEISKSSIQILFLNFFNGIKTNKNPFVLGYRVVPIKIKTEAGLMPTGIKYTASHSTNSSLQSFNYMMQLRNHSFPVNPPIEYLFIDSLLKNRVTEEADGVFAVDFSEFLQKQIGAVEDMLLDKLFHLVRDKTSGFEVRKNENHIWAEQHNHHFSVNLKYTGAENHLKNARKGIRFSWELGIRGNLHREEPLSSFTDVFHKSTIGIDFPYSSDPHEGRYKIDQDNTRGEHGVISLFLYPINDGKINFEFDIKQPKLGYEEENGPRFKSNSDRTAFNFLNIFSPFSVLGGMIKSLNNESLLVGNIKTNLLGELNLNDLDKFSNRVILPGSNVLAFKSMRLLDGSQGENDAVLFDVTYADTNE